MLLSHEFSKQEIGLIPGLIVTIFPPNAVPFEKRWGGKLPYKKIHWFRNAQKTPSNWKPKSETSLEIVNCVIFWSENPKSVDIHSTGIFVDATVLGDFGKTGPQFLDCEWLNLPSFYID